jgi:hypothetical protein
MDKSISKNRKNFFLMFLFVLFSSGVSFSQYDQYPLAPQNVERYEISGVQNYRTSVAGGTWDHAYAGKQDEFSGDRNTFRTIYSWSTSSIPSNAVIQSARLYIKGIIASNAPSDETRFLFEVKKFPNTDYNSGSSQQWTAITNSTLLFTEDLPRSQSSIDYYKDFSLGSDFITYIQSTFSAGKFHLAIRIPFAQEETWGTNRTIHEIDFKRANVAPDHALRLVITYTVLATNVSIIADNNFTDNSGNGTRGSMVIDGTTRTIPSDGYSITKTVGQSVSLTAVSSQTDNQNHQMIWHSGSTNPSEWTKDQVYAYSYQTYPITVAAGDAGKTYQAQLRKNYQISRNDQTEFDGTISAGVATQIVEQNSGQITAPTQQTINNKTYQFSGWNDGNVNNPRTISPQDNETYTVLYKYPTHTNQSTAFTNNNQRKIVKQTAVGQTTLHNVYESMGLVWYERSTNNGTTWQLANNGQPLSFLPSKSPSIDYFDNDGNSNDNVVITFQRIGLYENPIVIVQNYTTGIKQFESEAALLSDIWNNYYEDDVMPVIGYGISGRIMLVYKESGGLSCKYGNITGQGIQWYSINPFVQNTNGNSTNPTIAAIKQDNLPEFHLAWQEGESQIKYKIFRSPYPGNNIEQLTTQTLSNGSGYTHNRYPSIIVMRDVNAVYTARVTWQGTRYEEEQGMDLRKVTKGEEQNSSEGTERTRIVFKSSDFNYFWSFGNNTGKPNINRHSTAYAVAWSENNGSSVKFIDQISNNIVVKTISNISGKDVQVTNGSSLSDMYAISLNTTIAPYYFMKSNSLNTFSKPNLLTISSGREGVVYNEGAEFYFAIGDIKVNGNNTDFVEIPDSVKTLDLSLLNEYLRSQTISVDNSSQLLYSVQYGMIDSASTKNYLQSGNSITFGVELVDAITNNVLGRYDEVTFDENNMFSYDKLGYEVSLEGIGTNREVYLRLSTTSNDETSGYSLTQRYSDETILGKTHTKKINYTGTEKPTEYALYQNYPNPFNPVTTITYQIPKEGLVTLKIYDILGKEVTTLINEEKQAGKYSIDFNASKLSSGVYLYELRSNEFKSTKKLLLMK